ncbi:hypothetical protein DWUX_2073 [Desulfovibrio diazotrophicus]|nr:hypothetical protein DWUX_2073 [Desulfovibrio diazotrophicus]
MVHILVEKRLAATPRQRRTAFFDSPGSGQCQTGTARLWGCSSSRPDKTERFPPVTDKNRRRLQRHKKAFLSR